MAISEVSQKIINYTKTAKRDVDVLKSRVDTLTSLPDGSTTGDAELLDIRTKYDGTTATSAGNAVREQIESINDKITSVDITNINILYYMGR